MSSRQPCWLMLRVYSTGLDCKPSNALSGLRAVIDDRDMRRGARFSWEVLEGVLAKKQEKL
jgi:hypothetical protein